MERKKIEKLLENKSAKEIIYLYCNNKIYLTGKQLEELIELKNGGEKKYANTN